MGTLKDMEDMVSLIAQAGIEPEIGVILLMERAAEGFRGMSEAVHTSLDERTQVLFRSAMTRVTFECSEFEISSQVLEQSRLAGLSSCGTTLKKSSIDVLSPRLFFKRGYLFERSHKGGDGQTSVSASSYEALLTAQFRLSNAIY
jgi:hypothetical protein